MIYNKKYKFLFLSFLFLSHCALQINEKAPLVPKYKMALDSGGYCSELDYKKEFSAYFLADEKLTEESGEDYSQTQSSKDYSQKESSKDYSQKESSELIGDYGELSKGQRLNKALQCIRTKIETSKDFINHESLEKQELKNLLNQDFVKTESLTPIIDHILDPDYFNTYIFIKDNIINLIKFQKEDATTQREDNTAQEEDATTQKEDATTQEEDATTQEEDNTAQEEDATTQKEDALIEINSACYRPQNDKTVFSKKEVDAFVGFLENLSDFFLKLEQKSDEVFEQFFIKNSEFDKYLLSKSQLQNSAYFKNQFLPFLLESFEGDSPEYARLSEEHFYKKSNLFVEQQVLKMNSKKDIISQSLLYMAQLPPSPDDRLRVQNVKYMILNLYITNILFSIYDVDKSFILEEKELEVLSCLITPLISIVSSKELKDHSQIVKNIYKPSMITDYLLRYQNIPDLPLDWEYLKYRFFVSLGLFPASFKNPSYVDISRLLSVLFLQFFSEKEKTQNDSEETQDTSDFEKEKT